VIYTLKDTFVSINHWGIDVLYSLAPHIVHSHDDSPCGQWKDKGELSEDADGIVASAHSTAATKEKPTVLPGIIVIGMQHIEMISQ
jgi:hypothetical protein